MHRVAGCVVSPWMTRRAVHAEWGQDLGTHGLQPVGATQFFDECPERPVTDVGVVAPRPWNVFHLVGAERGVECPPVAALAAVPPGPRGLGGHAAGRG